MEGLVVLFFVQVGILLVVLVFVQVGIYGVLVLGFLQLDIGGIPQDNVKACGEAKHPFGVEEGGRGILVIRVPVSKEMGGRVIPAVGF
jgi:hypothetical protein